MRIDIIIGSHLVSWLKSGGSRAGPMPAKRRLSWGSRGASAGEEHGLKRPAAAAAVGASARDAPARASPAPAGGDRNVVRIHFRGSKVTMNKGAEIEAKEALEKAHAAKIQ